MYCLINVMYYHHYYQLCLLYWRKVHSSNNFLYNSLCVKKLINQLYSKFSIFASSSYIRFCICKSYLKVYNSKKCSDNLNLLNTHIKIKYFMKEILYLVLKAVHFSVGQCFWKELTFFSIETSNLSYWLQMWQYKFS